MTISFTYHLNQQWSHQTNPVRKSNFYKNNFLTHQLQITDSKIEFLIIRTKNNFPKLQTSQ